MARPDPAFARTPPPPRVLRDAQLPHPEERPEGASRRTAVVLLSMRRAAGQFHKAREARRAPSARLWNFAQTIEGCTSGTARGVEAKPQSAPAMTFSRPTNFAKRWMRSDT